VNLDGGSHSEGDVRAGDLCQRRFPREEVPGKEISRPRSIVAGTRNDVLRGAVREASRLSSQARPTVDLGAPLKSAGRRQSRESNSAGAIFAAQAVDLSAQPRDFVVQRGLSACGNLHRARVSCASVSFAPNGRNPPPQHSKRHAQPQTDVLCRNVISRYSTHTEAGNLVVVSPRRLTAVGLLLFLSCMFLAAHAFWEEARVLDLFMRSFFAGMLVAVFCGWLWAVAGREELLFTPTELLHRRSLFGLSHMKKYRMKDIRAPRFVVALDRARLGSRHPSGIAFTCDGKHVSLCSGMTQAEAKQIVDAVLNQFPELMPIWGSYAEGTPTTREHVSLNSK
jgi:hypothetical protein